MQPCRVCGGSGEFDVERVVSPWLGGAQELVTVFCTACQSVRHRYTRKGPDAKEWDAERRMSAPRSGWAMGGGLGARCYWKSIGDHSMFVTEHADGTADYRVTDMGGGRMQVVRERAGLASAAAAKRAASRWTSAQGARNE